MNRSTVNLAIDLAAGALFLGMLATGYILRFPLPPGTNKDLTLWGLTRHQWGDVHFWNSAGLIAVLLLHIALHWRWVVSVVVRQLRLPAPSFGPLSNGVLTFLIVAGLLGLFAWLAHAGVREIREPQPDVCPAPGDVEGGPSAGSAPAGRGGPAPDFRKDVYPILERACLSCHGPKRQRGDFRIDRRDHLFGGEGRAPLVLPGKAARSPLIAVVSGARPDIPLPDRHRLPAGAVEVLKAWIDAGAEWPAPSPTGPGEREE